MKTYIDSSLFSEYQAAREHFFALLVNLQSYVTQTYEHGRIESLLKSDGCELLRLLMH
jgi:hypothetical protein